MTKTKKNELPKIPWIKLFPSDEQTILNSMTLLERGAYISLKIAYIQNKSVFTNKNMLYALCYAFTEEERTAVSTVVERLFEHKDDEVVNESLDSLIETAGKAIKQKSDAGKKSAEARAKKNQRLSGESESESELELELKSETKPKKEKNTKEKLLDYLKSELANEHPFVIEKVIEFFNFRYEIKKGFKSEKGIDGVIRNLYKLKYPIHKIEMIQLSLDREYSGLFPDNIDTTKDIVDWKLVMRTLTPIEYGDLLGSPSIKDKLREMIKNLEVEQTTEAIRNFWNINGVHDYSKEIAEATTGLFGS